MTLLTYNISSRLNGSQQYPRVYDVITFSCVFKEIHIFLNAHNSWGHPAENGSVFFFHQKTTVLKKTIHFNPLLKNKCVENAFSKGPFYSAATKLNNKTLVSIRWWREYVPVLEVKHVTYLAE